MNKETKLQLVAKYQEVEHLNDVAITEAWLSIREWAIEQGFAQWQITKAKRHARALIQKEKEEEEAAPLTEVKPEVKPEPKPKKQPKKKRELTEQVNTVGFYESLGQQ